MTNAPPNHGCLPLPEGSSDPLLAVARKACALPENRFGPEFLEEHLLLVERFALQLAELLGADRRIVRAAALLHDVAAIRDFACVPRHAEIGAEQVASILSSSDPADGLRFDAEEIARIAVCVREHSSPQKPGDTSVESVCVSHADSMSQIVRPLYWFHYARTLKCLTHGDATEWLRSLACRNWSALLPEAKSLIEKEYGAVALVVGHIFLR